MKPYVVILLGVILGLWGDLHGLQAETRQTDACQALAASKQFACYQQRFTAADRELNAVYQHLATTLEAARRQAMQEHSRRWIPYKEALCQESTALTLGLEPAGVKRRPEYVSCLYDMTVARTAYLKHAFGQENVTAGLAGAYDDGFGGAMTLRDSGNDAYTFHLEVVRGPTLHTGDVEGIVRLQAKTATFVQQTDCGGDVPCCRLTFTRAPLFVHIEEEECSALHGARAYFSGDYWKVK